MRFAVDAHAIGQHLTGNETYIRNLLNGFARVDERAEIVAYISRRSAAEHIPDRFPTRLVSANPFLRLGRHLSRRLREDRPALLHVQYTAPLLCPTPVVVSVHDVSFLSHPQFFTRTRSAQLRTTVRRTVRHAIRVLTPSEFSRRSVLDAYALDEANVVAVHNGVSSQFRPLPRQAAAQEVAARFRIRAPYILTVGDLQPRKNHLSLFRAFAEVLRARPDLPHHLVVAGKETWYSSVVHEAARRSEFAGRIHFTGFVTDDELLRLYGGCDVFAFPSWYEGFGLPILEAMACARAVACSDTSAMPEVADSAALLFDPASVPEMSRAILDLLLHPELRARVERLGAKRAARFSWNAAAEQTLAVYRHAARSAERPVVRVTVPAVRS
ncbi:MAG TPA: glycosyltransferase family 1 protein [Bryobacteraceae bacterium]|nr:glycosyltransferase family 1 protein [Bryobacteraceae bacterium]